MSVKGQRVHLICIGMLVEKRLSLLAVLYFEMMSLVGMNSLDATEYQRVKSTYVPFLL